MAALAIILGIVIVLIAVDFFNTIFRKYPPLFTTRGNAISGLLKEINLLPNHIFMELGSGKADVSIAVARRYPNAKYIAVENTWFPYLIARLRLLGTKLAITFRRENMFATDISQADYIYCYLSFSMMEKLLPKFEHEAKNGLIVISYIFQFPNITPYKVVEIEKDRALYLYRFERK